MAVTLRVADGLAGGTEDFTGAETIVFRRFADWARGHAALFAGVPCEALLEATANAVIHRDSTLRGPVLVKALTSGIEVVSLGGLHGLTPDDLLNGVSLPPNPYLLDRFVSNGFARGTGSGLTRIMDLYETTGTTAAVSATTNSVRLILPRTPPTPTAGRIIRFPDPGRDTPPPATADHR